jgi:hypothetical protein
MSIFATGEQVALLKQRSLDWAANGFPNADKNIPMVMRYLNRFPDIAVVFSCEGHKETDGAFYIMFAVTEKGFQTIQQLYSKLQNRMLMLLKESPDSKMIDALQLEISTAVWPIQENENFRFDLRYNAVILRTEAYDDVTNERFFKWLLSDLHKMTCEMRLDF